MPVQCPQCGKQLMVPATAGGKKGRCPQCSHVFTMPAWMEEIEDDDELRLAPMASNPLAGLPPASGYPGQPLAANPFAPGAMNPAAYPQGVNPYAAKPSDPNKYNHAFGLEQRAFDAGIIGGIGLMVVSVVWFVGGLMFNVIFPYPAILFLIGLAAMGRGIYKTMMGS
jgi:hypothetical protein